MRVIAGEMRSIKLAAPNGYDTRPTSDKVKETLFNVLMPYIYSDSCFLDLFAGSGAIGIEALSRGAKRAVFAERSKAALKCIEENIKKCRLEDRTKVISGDVFFTLRKLEGDEDFDIIFLDPPYDTGTEKEVIKYLDTSGLLRDDGIIIAESSSDTDYDFLSGTGFEAFKVKEYKNNKHVFMRREQNG
ncbi:MAG: 16S rRNA (guanine(966)-N(2))-methyltransferase RsmD [Lachnospiraceae bacterium]|nr:16S rRNA (guanine(966)-N(2))-methyltransferase RsmD [Lachnospiraceae bacterium]